MDTKEISLKKHIQKTLGDYLPDDLVELATENIMLHDKLQPQQTVSNEEIENKAIDYACNLHDDPFIREDSRADFFSGADWMRDELQPQTNEGELIELLDFIRTQEIRSDIRFNLLEISNDDILTQFKALQKTNKE